MQKGKQLNFRQHDKYKIRVHPIRGEIVRIFARRIFDSLCHSSHTHVQLWMMLRVLRCNAARWSRLPLEQLYFRRCWTMNVFNTNEWVVICKAHAPPAGSFARGAPSIAMFVRCASEFLIIYEFACWKNSSTLLPGALYHTWIYLHWGQHPVVRDRYGVEIINKKNRRQKRAGSIQVCVFCL